MQPTVLNALHHVTSISRYGEALGLRMMTVNASSTVLPMVFGSASGRSDRRPVLGGRRWHCRLRAPGAELEDPSKD